MRRATLLATNIILFAVTCSAQDQIVPRRGTPLTGKIVTMSPVEVTIEVRGTNKKIAVNDLRRVTFREDPPELKRARDKALVGQFAAALDDLKQLEGDKVNRDYVQQDIEFLRSLCEGRLALSSGGDKAAASDALRRFATRNKDSFHFLAAAELLGDLAVAQEKFEDAARFYKAIAVKAPWPETKVRAGILEARSLLASGDAGAAKALFESAEGQALDTQGGRRQRLLAAVGRASCLIETGALEEARAILDEIVAENTPDDSDLFGRVYNALGRCHAKAGKPKDALLAYLHTDILFYATPDVHAESLYNLSRLWESAKRSDRAVAARDRLTQDYAGSRWANQ